MITMRAASQIVVAEMMLVLLMPVVARAQTNNYARLVAQAQADLKAGNAAQALAASQKAIKMDPRRWEAYVVAGGALEVEKHYTEAVEDFTRALDRAPSERKAAVKGLLEKCMKAQIAAQSQPAPAAAPHSAPEQAVSQAEVVLWKTIQNSTNPSDFKAYLQQYPNGAFAALARQRLQQMRAKASLSTTQQWKSRAEYDAFQAFVKETDAHRRILLIQGFIKNYPDSNFIANAYETEMQTYVQLNQTNNAIAAAKKAIAADPNNVEALYYLSFAFPYNFKPGSNATEELATARKDAQHGLEVLKNWQKPPGVSESQYESTVKADRATFNTAAGFAALQQKNYSQAIKSLEAATQDNPTSSMVYSLLGEAYYNESPREAGKAIWNLARATQLAEASNRPNVAQIKRFYSEVYEAQHGSNAGEEKLLADVKSQQTMPVDFSVAPPPHHGSTGNPNLDEFYKLEDALAVGGDIAQQNWRQLKGQTLGLVGDVDSVVPGTDPRTYEVRVDITPQSQSEQGIYDIVLQDSQPNAKDLQPGDPLRFQGTLSSYSTTPNFTLTLSDATTKSSR